VVGVGHRLRGDDLAGPLVCDMLKERLESEEKPTWGDLQVIDSDVMPENFAKPIRESGADLVIFVDAIDSDKGAGTLWKVGDDDIGVPMPNTHSLPLSFLIDNIRGHVGGVLLIGIQAKGLGMFTEMSPEVKEGCRNLIDMIWEGRWDDIHDIKMGIETGPIR